MEENKELGFLEDQAGAGLDSISSNEMSLSYLGMVQPDSEAAVGGAGPGVWRNSTTGDEYGKIVRVIPVAFKTIWNERENVSPFRTVGRYEPHSIQVQVQQPKGGKGYPKMINPDTGNEVQELYVYALMLPEHPECGVMFFNPTVSSMTTCKAWNTQLKSQLLSSGRQAPIYAFSWDMVVDLVDNPQKKGAKMAKFVKVQKAVPITKELFTTYIEPQKAQIQQSVIGITLDQDSAAESN